MKEVYKKLLRSFLIDFTETLDYAGCNDWAWPRTWNTDLRRKFLVEYNKWLKTHEAEHGPYEPEEFDLNWGPPDFMVVLFLRDKLLGKTHG